MSFAFFGCYTMRKSNTQTQLKQPAIVKIDEQNNEKDDWLEPLFCIYAEI